LLYYLRDNFGGEKELDFSTKGISLYFSSYLEGFELVEASLAIRISFFIVSISTTFLKDI